MILFLILGISMADVYISSLAGQPSDVLVRDMKALELFFESSANLFSILFKAEYPQFQQRYLSLYLPFLIH